MIKIKYITGLVLFFTCFSVFSQEKFTDSLFRIEISEKVKDYKKEVYFNKSATYFVQKKWDSTLVYAMKQLSLPNNNKTLVDYCHFFRGYSFVQKSLLKEAKNEFNKISDDFFFYDLTRIHLGGIELALNNYKDAITYFTEVENLPKNNYRFFKKSYIKNNLGICYLHLNKFDIAEKYLLESIQLQEEQKDTMALIGSYGDIGTLYYDQYKDDFAIPYFEKAYRLSKKTKSFQLKANTALNMAVVEKNRKQFEKALIYREEFDQWKDSLNNQNKIWEVAKLEKQFAIKQKQKEVSLLQAENKIQIAERNGFLYTAVVLFLLLGTGIYFYRQKIKTNKIILAQKESLDELNATKDKLFSIVSHDLRSSVHAMKMSNAKLLDKVATKNLDEIDVLLHQNSGIANSTYNLLDNLLNWALLQTKQSFFEVTSLRLFFVVEHVAYNYQSLMIEKNIIFENTVSKSDIALADQESIKITLRNFIDNAIKFSNENGFIKIYSRNLDNEYCTLIIEDNGLGMSESNLKNLLKETTLLSKKENEEIIGTGLGMQLCKSMIAKNNGRLDIKSELGKGTKIIIYLPKKQLNG